MNRENMSLLEQHFDVAFAAPDGIKRSRLGCLVNVKSSKRIFESDYCDSGVPFYRSREVGELARNGHCEDRLFISEAKYSEISKEYGVPKKGDILLTSVGSIGGCWIVDNRSFYYKDGNVTQLITDDFIDSSYITLFIGSNLFTSQVLNSVSGTAYNALTIIKIKELIFPLPPLAEQRRIVAKIDQLMARCDELEKLRIDRSQLLLTVHTAALDRLLTAKDSSEFSTAWSFITQHFGELYSVKENVVELRKTILQLAVMGKLVPQDPNDEPASIQFEDIRQQIDDLVRRKVDKEVKFKCINAKDEAFLLPDNWLWVRLGSLLQSLKYGTSKKCEYNYPGTAVLRIPNIDVDRGCIDMEKIKYTELLESELQELYLKPNDLLIIRSNGSLSLVGRTAVISEAEEGLAYAGYLVRLRSLPEYVYSRYLYFALNTVSVRNQIEQPIRSTSGVKNINSTEIANISIPLPPLAEQGRIVEKIDRLMGMCDRLEESIESGKGKQTTLLNALMSQV
jgi:type I restriction enzyme, S subunit